MIKRIKTALFKILLVVIISMVFTLLAIFLTSKYQIKIISVAPSNSKIVQVFQDLNYDGESEKVEYQQYSQQKSTLTIYNSVEQIIAQNVFNGVLGYTSDYIIGDLDNDKIMEVLIFTVRDDSLYLHGVDYFNKKVEFEDIPVCRLYPINNEYQYVIMPAGLSDVNSDGYKEVFFSITTGYMTRPRNLFAYYPLEKKIITSPESCAHLHFPVLFDIDGDNIPEIFSCNSATGNCKIEREYTDLYGWLMVFTPEMKFKFPPVRFDAYPSETKVIPFKTATDNLILVLHWYRGSENIESFLALYDSKGTLVKKRRLMPEENCDFAYLFSMDKSYNDIYIIKPSGVIYKVNENLQFIKEAEIDNINPNFHPVVSDIDYDGSNEMIVILNNTNEITILRKDFSDPVKFIFSHKVINTIFSTKVAKTGDQEFVIETNEQLYFLSYDMKFASKYWYLLFVIILIVTGILTFLITKIDEFRKIKLINTRNQLAELQLRSVQNQIDPHFTFNLLESFGNLLNEHDTERAEYIFNKYSSLLKATVLNSDKIMVTLYEELDFVTSYLDLEKFRYKNKFDFEVSLDNRVDTSILIPKMLIHIFVENAIKHGLKHRDKPGGRLMIVIIRKGLIYEISITDNGIGRQKASEIKSFSTGKGISIFERILELNFNLNRKRISYRIEDIIDGDKPSGTKVLISVPV